MTGHQPLLSMRLRGQHPPFLWVQTSLPANRDWDRYGEHPEVGIGEGDYPELLDLRFAMGLTVIVDGSDPKRVASLGKAFEQAKAKRVICNVDTAGEWPELMSVSDTDGVLTWPK